ncbi:MAG TPA: glycoside hydrolase family 2 TIM barrel-domain containing protein [Candidatus Acidoferrum sp.]|nr:glycoside hydrolase family 2 TIM barrel-domain containing protein [Candidatus Acidoferrum sp.]
MSGRGKDDAVPWRFRCTANAQSGYWTNLPVPSNWELHGFGTLSYKKDPTNAWDEKGLYERDFTVPADWSGRRVYLVFDGAMTDTSAKLNGEPAGPMHQGGYYRFKYEVTRLLKFGATNRLEVTVAKHSANASVNKAERLADYWVFGGLYRPVYLEAAPPQFIERVAIDARADGAFSMDVFASGITDADSGMKLEAQITDLHGQPVGPVFAGDLTGTRATLKTQITSPHPWTAETPNLYKVEVRLKHGDQVLHRFTQRFGFRTFEVRDGDGLYVNGRKVRLKGVCRHSFWPDSGRCLSTAVQRLDIESIKDMNANAVRMSHYPPDAEFLDLCDELGLYVLDELAGWHNYYDTDIGTKLVGEMVTRDVNHPCILFWDNGNEGGFNTNLDRVFGEFDPQQRRVLHPWATFNGLCTAHYLAYDKARIAAAGQSVYYHANQELVATNDSTPYIYLPTEFQHGLFDGGAGAGLDDFWAMMMRSPRCGGGFIWAWTDDAVKRPDTGEMDTAGNQAPDGIVGPYRQREASYYAIREIWSPIQVRLETNGTLIVENRYSFTDASQCRFVWRLHNYWETHWQLMPFSADMGVAKAPSIPPGTKCSFQLNLPQYWNTSADALSLVVQDPNGRELGEWVWPLSRPHEDLPQNADIVGRADRFGGTNTGVIELKCEEIFQRPGNIIVRIDGRTGELIGVERHGKKFSLANGPRPAATNITLKKVAWQLRRDGGLQCDYTYAAEGTNAYFGVVFDYPEGLVKSKLWLGNGPYRVWKNRLRGQTLGVWKNDYNNTITGWRDWLYPEFKGCFADVRWLQLDTAEGPITVVPEKIPYVQVLTPEWPPTNLVGKAFAPLPQCGLGFLNAIPAIGSKFKDATALGPQSQPNVAQGVYSGSVSFYFGKLP